MDGKQNVSEGHLLTAEEKERFTRYLRENSLSCRLLLKNVGNIPALAKKLQTEAACFDFVANYLQSGESVTITKGAVHASG